ncbi:DUF6126 family protein [Kitasatospora sp. NPDC094011]|uniref:DUF6126 family protein n=1 Tax=Kitasatospora sp. NPDC094011 TaxID=3364090 RepID=UPI003805CA76
MSDHADSAARAESADRADSPVKGDGVSEEKSRRRAMLIRAGIYIFATHLFAGFVLLLFALGDRK